MKRLNGMDAMLLYSETPNLHTHTLKVAVIDAADYDGRVRVRGVPQDRGAPAAPARAAALPAGRHPVAAAPPDVDAGLSGGPRLPPAPGARSGSRRPSRTRSGDRRDRQHAAGPHPPAVGVLLRRGDGRRPLRTHRQGAPHPGRRCGLGQSACAADGSGRVRREKNATNHPTVPCARRQAGCCGRRNCDHFQNMAALPHLVADAARGVTRLRKRAKTRDDQPDLAKPFNAPPTFLNHVVSPVRTFATATLSLAEVKETGKHLGVTFNDVVLAVAAGGLRELLLRYDGRADRPLMATVPVSTDQSTERVTGNEIGGLMVSLPVHIDDPLERVRLTSLATARAQGDQRTARPHAAGPDAGVPAATAGPGAVPRAVQARGPQPADERRGLQRPRPPAARPHRRRTRSARSTLSECFPRRARST